MSILNNFGYIPVTIETLDRIDKMWSTKGFIAKYLNDILIMLEGENEI
jgi:hypothetical protein